MKDGIRILLIFLSAFSLQSIDAKLVDIVLLCGFISWLPLYKPKKGTRHRHVKSGSSTPLHHYAPNPICYFKVVSYQVSAIIAYLRNCQNPNISRLKRGWLKMGRVGIDIK